MDSMNFKERVEIKTLTLGALGLKTCLSLLLVNKKCQNASQLPSLIKENGYDSGHSKHDMGSGYQPIHFRGQGATSMSLSEMVNELKLKQLTKNKRMSLCYV